jgi:hypothetical protein
MAETKPRKPFVIILGVLVILVIAFFVMYSVRMGQALKNDPQTVAGAAHVVGADTPSEAYASVTTGAKPLAPGEAAEAVTSPGQPASPAR